jgi:hypothetical protein
MDKLGGRAWPLGWVLIAVGFAILVGGTSAWAADYVTAVSGADSPSWLALVGGLSLGILCNGLGVVFLAAAGDRRKALQQQVLKENLE